MSEYWDYIKIYGLDGSIAECFQGLGAAALYGDAAPGSSGSSGGSSGSGETPGIEAMSEAIWAAQSAVLTQQSKYLDELGELYMAKKAAVPKTETLVDWFIDVSVEWFCGQLGGAIADAITAGNPLGEWAGEQLGEFFGKMLMAAYDELKLRYNAGTVLCEQVAQENTALLGLENSRENYLLRSTILVQHEHTIGNVMAWIQAAEEAAKQATGAATGGSVDLSEITQSLKDLQYNGERLQLPDGSIMTLIGKSMILEEA